MDKRDCKVIESYLNGEVFEVSLSLFDEFVELFDFSLVVFVNLLQLLDLTLISSLISTVFNGKLLNIL